MAPRQDIAGAVAPTPTRIAAYVRVSTEEQKVSGLGLESQRQRCAGMATAKGWPTPTVYADEGISGTKESTKRPALAQLLADVRAGEVDAVIVLDLSRLARKTMLVLELVEQLRQHGVSLVSCKESLDTTTAQGQFVLTMFAALAQLERDLISERTKAALGVRSQIDGNVGWIPHGYHRGSEKGSVVVDEVAAQVVRHIFTWRRAGHSLRAITARLRATNAPAPRGGIWQHSTVAVILRNRTIYRGGYRGASELRWPAVLKGQ